MRPSTGHTAVHGVADATSARLARCIASPVRHSPALPGLGFHISDSEPTRHHAHLLGKHAPWLRRMVLLLALLLAPALSRSDVLFTDTAFVPPYSTQETVFRTANHGYWVVTGFPSGYLPPSGKFEDVQVFDAAGVTHFNFPRTGVTITAVPLSDQSPVLLSGVIPQVMRPSTLFDLSDGNTWKVIDDAGGGGAVPSTRAEPVLLYRIQGQQQVALLEHGGNYRVARFTGTLVAESVFIPPWAEETTVFRTTGHGYWVITGFPSGYLPPSGRFEDARMFVDSGSTHFSFASRGITISAVPLADPSPRLLSGVIPQVMGPATLVTLSDGSVWMVVSDAGGGGAVPSSDAEPILLYRDAGRQLMALLAHGGNYEIELFAQAPPCSFSLSSAEGRIGATGGQMSVGLNASNQTCAWMASSNASWITVTYGASGAGSGVAGLVVGSNSGSSARTGTVLIGGQLFTVVQDGFVPVTHALTVVRTGDGLVTSGPPGIACGTDCSEGFVPGSSVILNAVPGTGSMFVGWGGPCSGTGRCVLTIAAATEVTASFRTAASVQGTSANDVLSGSASSDLLYGLEGDDRIAGQGGDDYIDGGAGDDVALYTGPSQNFWVERSGGGWRVVDKSGIEGGDTLHAVERLQFVDKAFALVNPARSMAPVYGRDRDFLFDGVFYLLDNADLVPLLGLTTAVQHYLNTGASQGRTPNSWFDATYYKSRWPDLTPLNLDNATLFLHYNLYGVWEGRAAGPKFDQFDGDRYLRDYPDVAAYVDGYLQDFLGSRTNGAIAHYVIYGARELRLAYDVFGRLIDLDWVTDLGQ